MMFTFKPGVILRLFIGEWDAFNGEPLYRLVLEKARAHGLTVAGAFRADAGYGASRRLRVWVSGDIPPDFPLVVELVGGVADIHKIVADLDQVVAEGLVTLEAVQLGRIAGSCLEEPRGHAAN